MRDGSNMEGVPKRVYGRPPVGGTGEELEAWVDAFIDALLGPEDGTPDGGDAGEG